MILVAGVAELFQGDLDLGRRAVERLAAEGLGDGVIVEELSYGGVAVAQRLEDLRPEVLVLIAAHPRGRVPGSVERREIGPPEPSPAELQLAVGDAVTGYVTINLLIEVAQAFKVLPARTVCFEVEPASVRPSEEMTPEAEAGLEEALELVRAEVMALRRAPGTSDAELVRDAWNAFARGDVDAALAVMDPNVRWHGAGDGEHEAGCHGREEVLAFIRQALADGVTAELLDVRPVGDRLVTVVQTRVPPEWGERPEPHGEVVTVRDGQIVEMLVFPTVLEALAAAGAP